MMYKNNFVAVIKCNGQILREQGGAVYLPFGAEYSILLKNKSAVKALVTIDVDGEDVLSGHSLIVRGNETQEIKGFMRNMRKTNRFKFIHKTREIQKHRGDRIDDGLVRVTYQFEQNNPIQVRRLDYKSPNYDLGAGSFRGCNWTDNTTSYSCNLNHKFSMQHADEGITVKGEKIDQGYQYGNVGALESAVHTIVLHLKGATSKKRSVKKPLTVRSKAKCVTCGRSNKSTNKFCYNCGTYLN